MIDPLRWTDSDPTPAPRERPMCEHVWRFSNDHNVFRCTMCGVIDDDQGLKAPEVVT